MSMSKKDISDFISATLKDYGWGKGYGYQEVYVNDTWYGYLSEAKKVIKEGDVIKLRVYKTVRSKRWGLEEVRRGNVSFIIENNDYLIDGYRAMREWRSKVLDSKRQAVYDWERDWLPKGEVMTLKAAQKLAN